MFFLLSIIYKQTDHLVSFQGLLANVNQSLKYIIINTILMYF